jgi:hypothetical protein
MYQDDTQSLEAELEQWIDIARHGNMALLSFNGGDAKYRPVAHAKEIASKLLGALKNELMDGDALRRSMEFIAVHTVTSIVSCSLADLTLADASRQLYL